MNDKETQAMLAAMDQDQTKGKSNFWTPEDGKNKIRILPPLKPNNEVLPYFHHKTHWIDGKPYECLDQSFLDKDGKLHSPETCPACKMAKKLYKISEKDSEEREIAYSISAKDRYIFRIVVRGKEDESQPEFYEVGPSIFKKFYSIVKSGEYGNIVHPTEGRDFIIDKQGTGRRTNYDNSLPSPKEGPIFKDNDDLKKCLTAAVGMKYGSLVTFPSYEEIENAVNEYLNPDSTDIGSSSAPKKEQAKKSNDYDDDDIDYSKSKKSSSSKNEDTADNDQIDDILSEFI